MVHQALCLEKRVTQLIQIIKQLEQRTESASKTEADYKKEMEEKEKLMGALESRLNGAQQEVNVYKKEMEQIQ